jgi:hypothetical protein
VSNSFAANAAGVQPRLELPSAEYATHLSSLFALPSLTIVSFYRNAHTTFYSRGVALVADAKTEEADNLLGIALDTASQQAAISRQALSGGALYARAPTAAERTSLLRVDGKTWALAEVQPPRVALLGLTSVRVSSTSSSFVLLPPSVPSII